MRRQYLRDPIENIDFHTNADVECGKLYEIIMRGDYSPGVSHRALSEKSRGLCRQVVIPSPRDALVLQCLSDAMYEQIRGKAPTSKAFFEPQDHSFSAAAGDGYGTFGSWLNFQKEIFRFSQERDFVVVTDIANYYDSISYVHLRNIISTITDVEECILDMLIFSLAGLLWQPDYMPRVEVGLPQIDMDAPRLLAHCFLYELDEYLQSTPTGDFTRFMDDIDVGVDSISDAKKVLKSIDLVLQTRQIRLNSGKTRILTRAEAERHFRIAENSRLNQLEVEIDIKVAFGLDLSSERAEVSKLLYGGIRSRNFDSGNGEKILKRLINISSKLEISISHKVLFKILVVWPSVRETVYGYISRGKLTPARVRVLSEFVRSGLLVDNVAYLEICNVLVESLFSGNGKVLGHISEIYESIVDDGYFGAYAAIWLMSKYADTKRIMEVVKEKREFWISDERFGRLVAGLYPIMHGSGDWDEFLNVISGSRNEGCRAVYKFHHALKSEKLYFNKVENILNSPNKSKATKITHAKFLLLMSAIANGVVDEAQRKKMVKSNSGVWQDARYRFIARRCAGLKDFC